MDAFFKLVDDDTVQIWDRNRSQALHFPLFPSYPCSFSAVFGISPNVATPYPRPYGGNVAKPQKMVAKETIFTLVAIA